MNDKKRRIKMIAMVVGLYGVLTACVTWQSFVREIKGTPEPNRGIEARHDIHAAEGLDCSDCHDSASGERMTFPTHETCSVCHDIPENSITDYTTFSEEVSCQMCHTRADYTVAPRIQLVTSEIKFDHEVHVAAETSCTECHENPDRQEFDYGDLMATCMACHENADHQFAGVAQTAVSASEFTSNDCAVCHNELTKDTIPEHRHGERIAHDSSSAWLKLHGQESYVDAAYCAQCHVEQEDCTTCHRLMKPANHTLAWNRKLHGAHAGWDSQSCSVCHEEDSCMKCHKETQPRSHRASFASPRNNHCVECHVPAETSCTICHETIEHRSAPRSPHDEGGGFPGNCAECHPGGLAGTAPHRINVTADCRTCHQ